MKIINLIRSITLLIICLTGFIQPQGKVYLVLGSDTAIWDGMGTATFHDYYNLELFTSDNTNTTNVMDETFRNQIFDSYGNKLKMTWWMMAGNIFRYATNNNIPISNTMTLHLMKKYFGDKIELWGDELSLHYHTFSWTDYDGDGKYWWNQAHNFLETKDDFDFTLAQFLLEENIFPVSFRSGWHYMDNDWQQYLNKIIPYSLHNDYPNVRESVIEPIDNVYDWSQASSEFVPFNPSETNYQLQGNSKSWNVRSKYMGSITQQMMNTVFLKAKQGTDQLVCGWSHLPEEGFLSEIQQLNNILHQAEINYPTVKFRYCTAVEAYQYWLHNNDNIKPELSLTDEINGNDVKFLITSNEPIFQMKPFLAIKDKYERYVLADCERLSKNRWRTVLSFPKNELGKVGAAITDTAGNLSTKFIKYIPDDIFIDNGDSRYSEIYGNWTTSTNSAWNLDSRIASLNYGDSAKVKWVINSDYTGVQNIFVQFPQLSNHIDTVKFDLIKNGIVDRTIQVPVLGNQKKWLYVTTIDLINGENGYLEMSAKNEGQITKVLSADVLKQTAYVRERQINITEQFYDAGEISVEDSLNFNIEISNTGISDLTINNIYSNNGLVELLLDLPIQIGGMQKINVPMIFIPEEIGSVEDTIIIISNDPVKPICKIPFTVMVENYSKIVDNSNTQLYLETGVWYNSVALAYGLSSRYAYIQTTLNGPTATFSFLLNKKGIYDIFEIIPTTVNSANKALYKIFVDGIKLDSLYLNQNEGSGSWKNIGRYVLPANKQILVKVMDTGESSSGPVIRADAIKILLFQEITDVDDNISTNTPILYQLFQNYPNPFNPSTKIRYDLPESKFVSLKIYDVVGKEITTLINKVQSAGTYEISFDASMFNGGLASGIYFYQLAVDANIITKKMLLLQ
ncbi:MAG: T9SS type A sorting domain-containing protein [bacterium]